MSDLSIAALTAEELEGCLPELGVLLLACVEDGASVSFVLPLTPGEATDFWRGKVLPSVREGGSILLVARIEGRIAGVVELAHKLPPNQPHRAEVNKLLVHPDFRRRGLARKLMLRLEEEARTLGKTLLVLDTRTGDKAEPLYTLLGFETVGQIPHFAVDPHDPGKVDATTVMYKRLEG